MNDKEKEELITISISRQDMEELLYQIEGLMCSWNPSSNQSDYMCEWCFNRATTNLDNPKHKDNCLGQHFLTLLKNQYETKS